MKTPVFPVDESLRLQALQRTGLLDTPPEARFDRLTRIARQSFGVEIALISLVDSDRQWFKSAQGLNVCETGRDISFCGHAILDSRVFVVEDTLRDERFIDNPLVTQAPHIRFYAGAPLHSQEGYRVGTLCVIDSRPRRFGHKDTELLRTLADCVEELMCRQRLEGLFELSSIAIVLSDAQSGRILDVNQALLDATGYDKAELSGLSLSDLTPSEYVEADNEAGATLARHGRYGPFEKKLIRRDGSALPVRQQGMLIRDVGGQPLVWTLMEDITELKKVERMQKEFVSTVSHELRTPLTAITGSLGLLAQGAMGELAPPIAKLVEVASNNSRRLNLLINDLLDMEKLVAGKMHFDVQAHDLAGLLHEAVECHRPLGEDRGVELVLGEPPAPVRVRVDRDRLLQALANLVSNAVKFSPDHGRVDIYTEPAGQGSWRVLVQDRGEGIPESFRTRVFEKFAQADSSDTRPKGGTGLGLAITQELMERMGGAVGFESKEGEGACFWLDIPAAGEE
ncbi:GAF domain-containing sensor histidine kinase [Oceanimonas marisflavi]|uniref:GAF domain-containing sensor histidine kinase n=1 Tax=Oceanimonas marisflavi TaxID=2059724 RepID=UPI000D30AABA|nr:ATP-binding protein [Oceanimonas marisflavi]